MSTLGTLRDLKPIVSIAAPSEPQASSLPASPPSFSAVPAQSTPKATATLHFSGAALLRGLMFCLVVVTALHLVVLARYAQGQDIKGATRFYFDNEGNLPAYFSTFIIFVAAAFLSVITSLKRADKDRFFTHWLVMTLLFYVMALDESLSIHELLIDPLRAMFGLSGLMRFSWIIAGGIFVIGFALAYLPFLAHLSQKMRWLFLASGVVYVTGAIGLEMASGPYYEVYESGGNSIPYMVLMTLEEILEMSGILLFIHTLLTYLKAYKPAFNVRLT